MNLKRFSRTLFLLIMIGMVMIGLASCKLPASSGPQPTSETSDGFPVPGKTEPTSGINISTLATQTAQARPPVAISTTTTNPYPAPTSAVSTPVATSVLVVLTPTGAPVVYVTATPGGPPAKYTLQEGEFLFCIARRFDLNIDELLTLNGLNADSLLSPGQELKIPQTGNPFIGTRALHDHPSTYTILAGDTLNRIACYFGDVSPDMIALQNHLTTTDLPVGEVLIIP